MPPVTEISKNIDPTRCRTGIRLKRRGVREVGILAGAAVSRP